MIPDLGFHARGLLRKRQPPLPTTTITAAGRPEDCEGMVMVKYVAPAARKIRRRSQEIALELTGFPRSTLPIPAAAATVRAGLQGREAAVEPTYVGTLARLVHRFFCSVDAT